jgi:hypothetical protein
MRFFVLAAPIVFDSSTGVLSKIDGPEILLIELLNSSGGNFDLSEIIEVLEFFEDAEVQALICPRFRIYPA